MAHKQNYVERMELNKQLRRASGLVSERFPEVSGIVIHMTYYHKGVSPILMVRTVNFFPSGYAYFNMDCMIKGCVDGGFDLTSVITDMIKHHKKLGKGKLVCNGKGDTLASDHASITYEIRIQYNKQSQ
ncbi:MAG: hypothetical protein QMC83_04735 [Thermodesulfovibrionales bacterium]|nr:hypothetical protein [Thermodesulfovibrionales bacterium]